MREIQTDYLIVGAGASGMAFADTLLELTDADIVLVDRRHRPGGHWNDAYPFVRLHQPSANYGVSSLALGQDRIEETGPDAGCYERATAPEIQAYYDTVLSRMLASGRVRFYGMSDYIGVEGNAHTFVSLLSGEPTSVSVRRKLVDAKYVETSIPSKHTPRFTVDDDVAFVPPGHLVHRAEAGGPFTVIGAGKTSMDTVCWLLEQGVAADKIRWVRSRDGWFLERSKFQPLDLVGSTIELQSRFVETSAQAATPSETTSLMEPHGLLRIDPDVEPAVFRGATINLAELEALRSIGDVVRMGRVKRIDSSGITLEEGKVAGRPGEIYVDCTAKGLNPAPSRPIFEPGKIIVQFVTLGVVPWSAATVAAVEALRSDDGDKNRLCPPAPSPDAVADGAKFRLPLLRGLTARLGEPDLQEWNEGTRLNGIRGAMEKMDDPAIAEAFGRLMQNMEPAMANLERMVAA